MNESEFRKIVRQLIKEEISPSERKTLLSDLKADVSDCIDQCLVDNNVHKKGLSPQQAAYLYRELIKTVDDKLQEFTSTKRPRKFKNYKEYIEKYNL